MVFQDAEETNAACNQHPIFTGALKELFCFFTLGLACIASAFPQSQ